MPWLYGFRYLNLNERLTIAAQRQQVGGLETGSYDVRATSNLYGGQIGTRFRRCWGLWSVEGTAKAGLFYNDAAQNQTVVDFPNFLVRHRISAGQARVRDREAVHDRIAFQDRGGRGFINRNARSHIGHS